MSKRKIFPIHLSEARAKKLVLEKLYSKLQTELNRLCHPDAVLSYSGTVEENGDTKLFVHFDVDSRSAGMMSIMMSGPLFSETIRPFTAEQMEALKEEKMLQVAREVYEYRKRIAEARAIAKIKDELFGKEPSDA